MDTNFRDCIGSLEEAEFGVRMPTFLSPKQRQFSTADANTSRLIIKIRWIIEAYDEKVKNGHYYLNVFITPS